MSDQSRMKQLEEQLLNRKKNAALTMSEEEIGKADAFCEGYKAFLNQAKIEREAVCYARDAAEQSGFTAFDEWHAGPYPAGSRLYRVNRGKAIILCVMGKKPVREGVRISAAHIDSPRLDLKPNPLYEESELALFKTHYYGGIKKYQWTAIPLSLHGRIVRQDNTYLDVNIGEDAGDPKFVVTDLLPHLATEQMKRTLNEGVKGEELNILIGSRPFRDDEASGMVKLNILKILNEKYGMVERDFLSAELELVPAFPVCDIGFDRSLIGGYGHDDRVCAYPALQAILDCGAPEYTSITVLTDKEEVGSDGNTGLNSAYLNYFVQDLARLEGVAGRDVLRNSACLSADVNVGFDPTYPDVLEKNNASFLNYGVVITKYTGSRGKADTSDASAEFMGRVRSMLDKGGVLWQTGELGRVDLGGGGTVAKYIANLDVDVVDLGVPVLSMHAPFEVVSKIDVYMAYRAFLTFFEAE